MSQSALKSRITKLEAKLTVKQSKVRGVIGGPYGQMISVEGKSGEPMRMAWPQPPGGFEEFARIQQERLQAELAKLTGEEPAVATPERSAIEAKAPVQPGQKPRRFLFTVEGGREMQFDTETGKKVAV